jgi:tripartite ATP-independent transporter DctM subunit
MRKAGYNDQLSTGSIAIGGTLGILIPPSTPMILYAITASCSVGSLFEAGILPGIMMATLSIITIVILCKINPDFAPSTQKCTWNERIKTLPGLIPVVLLFGIVMGGIFTGWFSVTQSAAVGAFVAMLLMALPKNLTIRTIIDALRECTRTFSMTFFIIIGASVFGNFLAITKMPMSLANLITGANINRYVVIVLITLIYLFLGMIMDELPMIMLTVPIFLPVIQALGFDKIWFGIYIIMAMELGALSPPVGLNCFIINGIQKDISLATIYKGVLPFILTIFVAITLITALPIIVTYLPTVLNQ